MGVNTINVTSTIFGLAIQYDRLDALCNRAFRNFNGKTINIFIDLYTIFKELRKQNYLEGNNVDICAGIINLAGHYRRFFLKNNIYAKIYLINSSNIPQWNIELCEDYNKNMVHIVSTTLKRTNTLIEYNYDLLDTLTPYLKDVYLIHSTYESSVVIYNIIKNNQDIGDNTANLVITKDIYPFQLAGICSNTLIYKVKKSKGQDISYCVGAGNLYNALLYENKINYNDYDFYKISPKLFSVLITLNGFKKRNIKSIYNIKTAKNLIEKAIYGDAILLNDYNSIINWRDIQPKVEPIELKNRFECLDIITQHYTYINDYESKYKLNNLYDPDGLRSLNEMYFKTLNPIIFDGLLME